MCELSADKLELVEEPRLLLPMPKVRFWFAAAAAAAAAAASLALAAEWLLC